MNPRRSWLRHGLANPRRSSFNRGVKRALHLAALLLLAACSVSRELPSPERLQQLASREAEVVLAQEQEWLNMAKARLLSEIDRAGAGAPAVTLDCLVLSGGGQHGAFGAGFLKGWGAVREPEASRPEFDMVSGVSTGSLIAPFALLGGAQIDRVDQLYRSLPDDAAVGRGFISIAFRRKSLLDISGLQEILVREIDDALAGGVAGARRDQNRLLLVGTTNLDLARMRMWDVGEEVARAAEGGTARMRTILLASCSIPAAFPPIEIDGCLHVDGGASEQLFGIARAEPFVALIQEVQRLRPNAKTPRVRQWTIVNGKLDLDPKGTPIDWPSVAGRSISQMTYSMTWSALHRQRLASDLINAALPGACEFRFVAIPQDFQSPTGETIFEPAYMRALADLGEKMGRDPASWRTKVR